MARIFCIANQKGGVGKTTTTVNLAAGLAKLGQRVLMIDLDPQGNATMGSGVDKRQLELTVYDVLLESASVAEARIRADKLEDGGCGYDVLGANRELAGAEVEMVALDRREKRLRTALATVGAEYDFVLIDCPPSLSLLTLNGLCAAHGVIVPMQCEYFALEGLTDLVNTIKQVHANLNKNLQIIGLLRVMFDPRITLQQQVSDQLKAHFGDKVFDTVIPRNVRLAEAPSYGLPGVVFDQAAKGSQAYVTFAQEMVQKMPPASATGAVAPEPPSAPPVANPADPVPTHSDTQAFVEEPQK
ncbi:ParA family protein [Variovorax sp. J22R133]|uniref:ParA family protein n=1 Tax=Variovorax brevis TaxID=3053503 RepID=UPI002578C76A|nr:ParA family protein [Variovorax sp. J22R133]MDM0111688.1 ParA family protein [Variovorax sp. J22R133]